jgi:hypothetical protein
MSFIVCIGFRIEDDEIVENATQGPIRLIEPQEKNCAIQ